MTSLSQRRIQAEEMDQPGLDPAAHRRALAGLARINRVSGTARFVWNALRPELERHASAATNGPLTLLDVACGGGDLVVDLARCARRTGYALHAAGCDKSAMAVRIARENAARHSLNIEFFEHDLIAYELHTQYDIVLCTLFIHHLADAECLRLLSGMAGAARRLMIVDDLSRGWLGLGLAQVGCRLLSSSAVVRVDGPRSVRAAFTPSEAVQLARAAGWRDVSVARHWPERFLLMGRPQ